MIRTLSLWLGLSLVQASPKDMQSWVDKTLGLAMQVPKAWQIKKGKDMTQILVPLGTVKARGSIEVFPTQYRESQESWQLVQKTVNDNMHREVEKQWTEEILGTPILMTRLRYELNGDPTVTLIGLMYSRYENKLHFRLTAPASYYDSVETQWRNCLLSLHTLSGELPNTEDPNQPKADPPPKKPEDGPKVIILVANSNKKPKLRIADRSVPCTVANRSVQLRLPRDYAWESTGDKFLTHAKLKGKVTLEIMSTLDSAAPDQQLAVIGNSVLDEFDQVKFREDLEPYFNSGHAQVMTVIRKGIRAAELRYAIVAIGAKGEYYWALRYSGSEKEYKSDKGILEGFLQRASVEPSP